MWKLHSLRKVISQSIPDLAKDPENFIVLVEGGSAASTSAKGLSFEYTYTIAITLLDYTGHTDALFVPLIAWLRVHQIVLLANPQTHAQGLQFQVELLNTGACDIAIKVPVTERVIVKANPDHPTQLTCDHPPEPPIIGTARVPEHWQLYLKDQLLAEWDIPTPPNEDRFELY